MFAKDGDTPLPSPPEKEKLEDILAAIRRDGFLEIYIVFAKGIISDDESSLSDAYCEFKTNGKELKTKTINKTINPIWDQLIKSQNLVLESSKFLQPITFKVFHHNSILSDRNLGEYTVNFEKQLDNPGKWLIDDIVQLTSTDKDLLKKYNNNLGTLYYQARWVNKDDLQESIQRPALKEDLAKELQTARVNGTVLIYVAHATAIIYVEDENNKKCSDAFAEFKISDKKEVKTRVLKAATLPVWNQRLEIKIDYPTADQVPPMDVKLWDYNSVLSNKLLGETKLDLKTLFVPDTNKNTWAYNEITKLDVPKDFQGKSRSAGNLYVQMRFVAEGTEQPAEQCSPDIKETPEQYLKQFRSVGTLQVLVKFAYNLIACDSGMMGSKSDPYVKFKPVGCNKEFQTKTIKDSLDCKFFILSKNNQVTGMKLLIVQWIVIEMKDHSRC